MIAHRLAWIRGACDDLDLVVRGVLGMWGVEHSPQALDRALPPATEVDLGGGRVLAVRVFGGPPRSTPVLMLHGWTLTADVNFSHIYDDLAARHRVIAYDCLAHGQGRRDRPFTLAEMADEAADVLDALGVKQAIVVGYSLGGMAAMEMVVRHPDKVAGIVVQAAAVDPGDNVRNAAVLRAFQWLRPLAATGLLDAASARYWVRTAQQNAELRRRWSWLRAELGQMSAADALDVLRAVAEHRISGALAACTDLPPAAYVLLARDRLCRPPLQRAAAAVLGATVIELDADHNVPLADPAAHSAATLEAVAAVEAQRGHRLIAG